VTRFKELKRIEIAIKQKNALESQWALGYCNMRLGIASRKDHQKYWRNLERTVQDALAQVQSAT